MLRRLGVPRALLGLVSAWFVLFSLLPGALQPCPMHGEVTPALSTPMAMSGAEMADHAHDAPAESVPEPTHPCDCVTTCCGVPAMALALEPSRPTASVVQLDESAALSHAPSQAPSRVRLLPYANGPPGSVSG